MPEIKVPRSRRRGSDYPRTDIPIKVVDFGGDCDQEKPKNNINWLDPKEFIFDNHKHGFPTVNFGKSINFNLQAGKLFKGNNIAIGLDDKRKLFVKESPDGFMFNRRRGALSLKNVLILKTFSELGLMGKYRLVKKDNGYELQPVGDRADKICPDEV